MDETYYFFNGKFHRHDFEAVLGDTYVEISKSWVDIRAGMLTPVWGMNDLVNPNDVLTAKDLRNGGAQLDPETARRAALALEARFYVGPLTLTTIWMPVFVPNRLDMFGSDFAMFGPGVSPQLSMLGIYMESFVDNSIEGAIQPSLLQTKSPRPVTGSTGAFRLGGSAGGWDFAMQYAYTHERVPVVKVHNLLGMALLPAAGSGAGLDAEEIGNILQNLFTSNIKALESSYQRFHQVGLSVSKGVSEVLLNLDVSYLNSASLPLTGSTPYTVEGEWLTTAAQSQILAYTLGARYTRGEEIQLQVEWWHRIHLDHAFLDPSLRPQIVGGGPHLGGLAVLFRGEWSSVDLAFQLLVHADFFNLSLIVSPQLTYRINDHLKINAGVQIIEGNSGSVGALFDHNDQIYLGIQGYL